MTSVPGGAPGFDFGPDITYSHELVVEEVIWPLVDQLWHGNIWREESADGFELEYPRRGFYENRVLDIFLFADCEDVGVEKEILVHSSTISIEEEVRGVNRSIVLAAARTAVGELEAFMESAEGAGIEDLIPWPEGNEDKFKIKKGARYTFDTDSNFLIELYRVVSGPYTRINVPLCEAESDGMPDGKIKAHDLDEIRAASVILGASKQILSALERIRAREIHTY